MIRSNENRYEAVLLDMDGVLINSMPCHIQSYNEVLFDFGISVSEREVAGQSTLETLASLLSDEVNSHELAKLARKKSDRSLELMMAQGQRLLIDDALEILELLHGRVDMALCTSASPKSVEYILETILPVRFFKRTVHSGMVRLSKPDPEIYLKACSMLSVNPSSCLVVEDSVSGIESGLAAGCDVAYIPCGERYFTINEESIYEFQKLSELPKFLGIA